MNLLTVKAIQPIFYTDSLERRSVMSWEVNQVMANQPMFFEGGDQDESVIEKLDIDNLNFILSYLEGDRQVQLSGNIRMNMLRGDHALVLIKLLSKYASVLPRLTLEIVEHGFNELDRRSSIDEVRRNLRIISSMGAVLSVDDYGSGHGAAGLLTWGFWNEVKIDGSIVVAAVDKARLNRARVVLKSTTDLLHDLGLVVVYEHIEDQSMLDIALEFGADCVQGFFLQRPTLVTGLDLSAEFFTGFVHERRPILVSDSFLIG